VRFSPLGVLVAAGSAVAALYWVAVCAGRAKRLRPEPAPRARNVALILGLLLAGNWILVIVLHARYGIP
jgi:hypothetical protein